MKTISQLENELIKAIDKNKKNLHLRKNINTDFIKKGLNTNVVNMLFDGDLDITQLNKMELIGLTKSLFDNLKLSAYNPNSYFTQTEQDEYDMMVVVPEQRIEQVIFNHAQRINDYAFQSMITAKHLKELLDNSLLGYNKSLQRPPVEVKMGRSVVKKISVDKEKVEDLKDKILNKNRDKVPTPTQIILSVVDYGKKLDMSFGGDNYNGTLIINPDYSSETPTKLLITDGFHRISAVKKAYEQYFKETGKELDYTLSVLIQVATVNKIKETVANSFNVNIPKEEIIKSIKPNSKNDFINKVVENTSFLDGKVSDRLISKNSNILTSKEILYKVMDYINIDLSDELSISLEAKNISKILNMLLNRLNKFNTILFKPNMFVEYIYISNYINKYKSIDNIIDIVSDLDKLNEEDIKDLNLDSKKCDLNNMIKFFNNYLGLEEINNE